MTIGTNARVLFFKGNGDQLTKVSGGDAVNDGAYSDSGDLLSGSWTNTDDAEFATIAVELTFASAPTAGEEMKFYFIQIDMMNDTGWDEPTPSANSQHGYIGSVSVDNAATQYFAFRVDLRRASQSQQKWQFYTYNDSGVNMSAGWVAKINAHAPGPHA